jgi:hypothetical protein
MGAQHGGCAASKPCKAAVSATNGHPPRTQKKFAIAKKVLRLCPPHWVQSPEVPFLIGDGRAKQKATRVAWPCRVKREHHGGRIAMLVIRLPKNVRRVRINFVRTFFKPVLPSQGQRVRRLMPYDQPRVFQDDSFPKPPAIATRQQPHLGLWLSLALVIDGSHQQQT